MVGGYSGNCDEALWKDYDIGTCDACEGAESMNEIYKLFIPTLIIFYETAFASVVGGIFFGIIIGLLFVVLVFGVDRTVGTPSFKWGEKA
jgi:hypothetical protein